MPWISFGIRQKQVIVIGRVDVEREAFGIRRLFVRKFTNNMPGYFTTEGVSVFFGFINSVAIEIRRLECVVASIPIANFVLGFFNIALYFQFDWIDFALAKIQAAHGLLPFPKTYRMAALP